MTTDTARYNGRDAAQLASDAEAAVLGIVHLAENHDPAPTPEIVYRTLSGLTRMLDNLPEAVTRLRAAAERQLEQGDLEIASGPHAGDPVAAFRALHDAIEAMLGGFGTVRTGLNNAQAALAGVTAAQQR